MEESDVLACSLTALTFEPPEGRLRVIGMLLWMRDPFRRFFLFPSRHSETANGQKQLWETETDELPQVQVKTSFHP